MDGQIIRQSASYRQGLVLGLTMAEIMLLFVFCLLIAMAAFLRNEHSATEAAETMLKKERAAGAADHQLVEKLKKGSRLTELLQGALGTNNSAAVDEFWRDLVESRDVASAAKDAGLTAADLRERGKDFKTFGTKGISVATALRDAKITASAEKALGRTAAVTPEEVGSAIERGLATQVRAGHQWPPIITLSDTDGQFFKSGSAELNPDFRQKLIDTEPTILRRMKEFDVDVIEVVGHTDERPVGVHQSTLDRDLLPVLKNETEIAGLVSADNAGLGLARAVSVVSVLRQNKDLAAYKILPLSGGQLIDTNETLAIVGTGGDVAERRRIEIRLRKANPSAVQPLQSFELPKIPLPAPKPKPAPAQFQVTSPLPTPTPPSSLEPPPRPVYGPPDLSTVY